MIDIKIDTKELERIRGIISHIPGAFKRASTRTLRRTMSKLKTRSRQLVMERYYAKSGDISKAQSTSVSGNTGTMRVRGSKKSLSDYYISPKTSRSAHKLGGIRAAVKKTGIKNIRKAFIINKGKANAYVRTGKKRWEVVRLMSPAIPQIMGNEEILTQLEGEIHEEFMSRLNHEALYELGVIAK